MRITIKDIDPRELEPLISSGCLPHEVREEYLSRQGIRLAGEGQVAIKDQAYVFLTLFLHNASPMRFRLKITLTFSWGGHTIYPYVLNPKNDALLLDREGDLEMRLLLVTNAPSNEYLEKRSQLHCAVHVELSNE
jgi:hypothetical protein